MTRAAAVNDDPLFLDMMADVVNGDDSALRAGKTAPVFFVTVRLKAGHNGQTLRRLISPSCRRPMCPSAPSR